MCQVLTSMPGIGVPAAAVLAGRDPGQDLQHRRPAGLLRRARSRHTPLRLIDPWRGASPTAATRGSSAPCSCPPSPPCAPTPSPGPTTSANETKANRLGPGRSRPGPPPHPDPARHDPRWSPLRPTTSHETTRRRLTHHIEAPPSVAPACAAAGRCSASRSHCIYLVDTSPRTLICANHQFCRWGVRHGFAGSMHSISGETPASQTISMVVHNVSDHDLDYWRKTMW